MPLDAVPATIAPSCLIAGYVSTGMEQVCNWCQGVVNETTGPLLFWVSASRRKLRARRRVCATCRYALKLQDVKLNLEPASQNTCYYYY